MELYDLIISRRTIREFQDRAIGRARLERYVNAGRLAPQAANRQPLEFIAVDDQGLCKKIFHLSKFAAHLEWKPSEDKMPRAYICILVNEVLKIDRWIDFDVALAGGNIGLAAWDDGVGSCLLGAFDKGEVSSLLSVPSSYSPTLIVALGYPAHKSFAEDVKGDDIKYRRDADGTFHVPKRPLDSVIHYNKFGGP
jgi:nitroreductase